LLVHPCHSGATPAGNGEASHREGSRTDVPVSAAVGCLTAAGTVVGVGLGTRWGDGLRTVASKGHQDPAASSRQGPPTGDRGTRRRAPVSNRPGSRPGRRATAASKEQTCSSESTGRRRPTQWVWSTTPAPSSPASRSPTPPTASGCWSGGCAGWGPGRAAGRHRAARRSPGRPAAGGRPPGRAGQAQGDQDLAAGRGPKRGQSDPGDAQVIAEYLRLRRHRLRRLEPFSAQTRALRAVVRTRDDLLTQRVAATNQLGAMLDGFWPGANAIFVSLDSQITLAFLERYPTRSRPPSWASDAWPPSWPSAATRAGDRQVSSWPACTPPRPGWWHRRGRCPPRRAAGPGRRAQGPQHRHQAPRPLGRRHLGEHPDAKIFTSLPRSGQINAAQMLAEWGDCRPAYAGAEAVAALGGASPVTKQSGKHNAVHVRWACNKRFRLAITTFADNSRHASPGPPRSTATPPPQATTISTPSASWHALDPGHLALLDGQRALRPGQARRHPQAGRNGCLGARKLTLR
jgi:hypothetical protein